MDQGSGHKVWISMCYISTTMWECLPTEKPPDNQTDRMTLSQLMAASLCYHPSCCWYNGLKSGIIIVAGLEVLNGPKSMSSHIPRLMEPPLLCSAQPASSRGQCWFPDIVPFLKETSQRLGAKLVIGSPWKEHWFHLELAHVLDSLAFLSSVPGQHPIRGLTEWYTSREFCIIPPLTKKFNLQQERCGNGHMMMGPTDPITYHIIQKFLDLQSDGIAFWSIAEVPA